MQFLKNNQKITESRIKRVCRAALVLALMSTTSVYAHLVKPTDDIDDKTRVRGLWQSGTKNNRKEALEILKKKMPAGDHKVRIQYLKKLGEYLKDNPVEIYGAQDILVDQIEDDMLVTQWTPLSSFYTTTLQMISQNQTLTASERDLESLKLQIFYRELPEQLIEGSTETLDKGIKKSLLNLQTNRGLSTRLLYKVLYLRNFYTDIDPDELKGIAKKSKQEADSMTPSQENEEERDILYRFAARTYFRVARDLTLKADINKMISRYQKAADLGYTSAKYMLASLYNDRSAGVYDPVKAYALYNEAMKEDPTLAVYSVAGFHELRALNKEAEEEIVEVEDIVSQSSSEDEGETVRDEDIAAQYQKREEDLAAQQQEQERTKAQLLEELQEIDREKESLKAAKDAFESEIAQQKEELERQQTLLSQRQEDFERLEEEGRGRQEQLVSDQENLRQANEELRVRAEELVRLQQEHTNQQAQLAQNQTTLAEKERELAQREADLTADRETLASRQTDLETQTEVLDRQRAEQQAPQGQVLQPQEAALAQQQQTLTAREAALTTAQNTLATKQAELAQKKTALDQRKQNLDTREATLATGLRNFAEKEAELAVKLSKPKKQKKIDLKTYTALQKVGFKDLKTEQKKVIKYYKGNMEISKDWYDQLVAKGDGRRGSKTVTVTYYHVME